MPTYDATTAECLVLTYKEGLLARAAHDLKLRVNRLEVEVAPGAVRATFDARSLEVVCAMRDGAENPGALSEADKRQVLENIAREVLHSARFGSIRFVSTGITPTGEGWRVAGSLDLHGVTRPVQGVVTRRGDRWTTRVHLHQPTWRIKPFTAMLGTLKIKPDVDVLLSVPAELPLGIP